MIANRSPSTVPFWPTWRNLRSTVREDWSHNSRNPKVQVALVLFRLCQIAMGDRNQPRTASKPLVVVYRFVTEIVIGFELRPKTFVGPGIAIHHAFGLVVNDGAIVGRHVQLRNGVTIGHKVPGSPPPVIGDRVEIGANAVIIGDIHIGEGTKVGAGAVVVKSCRPNSVLVGNPAKNVERSQSGKVE